MCIANNIMGLKFNSNSNIIVFTCVLTCTCMYAFTNFKFSENKVLATYNTELIYSTQWKLFCHSGK